jgi:phosphoribosylaminoimidazolecarboxamide formyltransferase/IMP cyclohydrolase
MPIALLSVSNKAGLLDFAAALSEVGWKLVASGGTAKAISAAGLAVTDIADLTGAPEMLGGRVKTLHPKVHGGILSRPTPEDRAELARHGIQEIEVVVCNLYPFQATVAKPGATPEEAIEKIDIGGVTLLRAAAKNYERVTVICDPADYARVSGEIRVNGAVSPALRAELARKAFAHTAGYDAAISNYLFDQAGDLPGRMAFSLVKTQEMRYGENPHQAAALYAAEASMGPLGGTLLQGKALSYNNMLDLDAAWQTAQAFTEAPTVVIVKHLSPCGIASAATLVDAFAPALASDPVSAFGGVIAVNRVFDVATAEALGDLFVEAIAAPGFTPEALTILESRKNCRLLTIDRDVSTKMELRSIAGGVLVQERDQGDPPATEWRVVTTRQPSEAEMAAMKFAWKAVQYVKSNSIVYAVGTATVGIGGGLPSRVDAAKLGATKAGDLAVGSVLASDAFFPFPDGVEAAAAAGVTAVIQPGGSIRDKKVIARANELGLAMVFTGVRHFRH